jgi:hypothetical protein
MVTLTRGGERMRVSMRFLLHYPGRETSSRASVLAADRRRQPRAAGDLTPLQRDLAGLRMAHLPSQPSASSRCPAADRTKPQPCGPHNPVAGPSDSSAVNRVEPAGLLPEHSFGTPAREQSLHPFVMTCDRVQARVTGG